MKIDVLREKPASTATKSKTKSRMEWTYFESVPLLSIYPLGRAAKILRYHSTPRLKMCGPIAPHTPV
jgi:hypothetical protein